MFFLMFFLFVGLCVYLLFVHRFATTFVRQRLPVHEAMIQIVRDEATPSAFVKMMVPFDGAQ